MTAPAIPDRAEDPKLVLARKLRAAGGGEQAARVLHYAALSSTFVPEKAMSAAGYDPDAAANPASPEALARFAAAAQLADACDTAIWQPDWIMRTNARARQIEAMRGREAEIVAWRRAQPGFDEDEAAKVICDALLGAGDFAPERVRAALAAGLSVPGYERLIRGLSLAQPLAPARDLIDALRAALARAEADAAAGRSETAVARDETAAIEALIEAQWRTPTGNAGLGIAYVGGSDGVGKSTLLSLVREDMRARGVLCATLDFARPGIDGSEPLGLSLELARQLAENAGAEGGTLYAAITAALGAVDEQRSNARLVAQDLLDAVASLLDMFGRRLLLSLDSLERLAPRGDTAAMRLVDWLQALRAQTMRVAMLAAGRYRGHGVTELPAALARHVQPVMLRGLPEAAARALLASLGAPAASTNAILAIAQGNPVVLQLAARLLASGGTLDGLDASQGADALARDLSDLIRTRLDAEPKLPDIADACLLPPRINAALLAEAIAPAIGIAPLTLQEAQDRLERIAACAWPAEVEDGWFVFARDLRAALIETLIARDEARARRLSAAAADWHEARGDAVLSLHHRLQGLRWAPEAPTVDPTIAAHFSRPMIDELPPRARALLALARGERSALFRAGQAPPPQSAAVFGPDAAAELRMLLQRRDRLEAAMMVGRAEDLSAIDPASPAGATVIEALWRGGDLHRAGDMLMRRRRLMAEPFAPDDATSVFLIAAFADLDPEAFRARVRATPGWARQVAARLDGLADPDWDVTALLLQAERIATDQPFAQATWRLWADRRPDQTLLDDLLARLRRAAGLPPAAEPASRAAIIALLARDAAHRDLLLGRLAAMAAAPPVEALARQVALELPGMRPADADEDEAARYVGAFAVDRVDALGGLADLADRLARSQRPAPEPTVPDPAVPDLAAGNLRMIAAQIARRRATVAGHWSYGLPIPPGWRDADAAERAGRSPAETHLLDRLSLTIAADAAAAPPPPFESSPDIRSRSRSSPPSSSRSPVMSDLLDAEVPTQPTNAIQEESRSRLSAKPGDMWETARRAIDMGLVRPDDFGLTTDAVSSPLEAVDNPVALEAIVLMTGRPPMLIQNNRVVIDKIAANAMGRTTSLHDLNPGVISAVEPMIPSIGRIEFLNHQMQWGGTGFVIPGGKNGRKFVVTNRHVAKLVARRQRDGSGLFLRSPQGLPYKAKIDMREEFGGVASAAFECPVERIVYLADDTEADCALLEISTTTSCNPAELELAGSRAKFDELVAAIGYPAYDERNEVAPMRKYFGDIYNVKRFAPGRIMQSAPGELLMHDCTTLGGNSGSALISLSQRAVVGLHFSGSFGIGNSAVSVETLKQLQTGRLFAVIAPQQGGVEGPADGSHQPEHFKGRQGFMRDGFLMDELATPMPEMSDDVIADLATPSDGTAEDPKELRYTNFSLYYSRSRKTPLFTAVNIDGERSVRIKRGTDKWYFDLRIPREMQIGQDFFPGALDRGHMVRREDPNFGPDARQANDDTFHYTNAALQHGSLNQGKTLWQGLENYILESARTEGFRACVFTGPILDAEDPELGMGDVLIPLQYWKVVVMPKTGGGLHATGYLLSQGDLIRKLLETREAAGRGGNESQAEGFQLGAYRTFQIAIRHIEQATGLRWPYLEGADPLADLGNEAVSPITYAPIDAADDLFL